MSRGARRGISGLSDPLRTHCLDDAFIASRSRAANLATVRHHRDVQGVAKSRLDALLQLGAAALVRMLATSHPPEPLGDAPHMRVDRKQVAAEGVHEHASGRLGTDAGKRREVRERFLGRQVPEKAQRRPPGISVNSVQEREQQPDLASSKSAQSNERLELLRGGSTDPIPAPVPAVQGGKRAAILGLPRLC